MITLKLPIPVSVNAAYAGFKRRFKSKKYKEWEEKAEETIKQFKPMSVDPNTPMCVTYRYCMPCYYKNGNHKRVDVFNYEKALSDFLSQHIEGFDDEWIYKGIVEKVHKTQRTVYIKIEQLNHN